MPLNCPNCEAPASRLITRPDVEHIFCESCRPAGKGTDRKLYSGRQFWGGHECMTRNQLEEKCYEYGERTKQKAATNRKEFAAQRARVQVIRDGLERKAFEMTKRR